MGTPVQGSTTGDVDPEPATPSDTQEQTQVHRHSQQQQHTETDTGTETGSETQTQTPPQRRTELPPATLKPKAVVIPARARIGYLRIEAAEARALTRAGEDLIF
ncbi:MAG: hypothetical protein NTY03_06440 [Candidatus Bathyarchaeota archaeon]|nr:hypothetical protein [Candidatus Bathyarchaeota archaeon]